MNYLITGGTGFIGSYVIRHLVARGDRVTAYDIAPNTAFLEQVAGKAAMGAVTAVRGDILDLAHLARTARQQGAEVLIHLAYLLGRDTEFNPTLAVRVNCEGTNNAFETACLSGIKRVVWASSIAVFGPRSVGTSGVVANDAPYHPLNIYGACKALNELVAKRYARSYGLEPIGLRFPLVYGPGAVRGWAGFLPRMVEDLVLGTTARAPRGDIAANWCFVDDIARGIVLAGSAPPARTPAFTLSGEVRTVGEAVDMIRGYFPGGRVETDERYPGLELPGHLEGEPARSHLGWQPRYSLEEGVRETVEFYRRAHSR